MKGYVTEDDLIHRLQIIRDLVRDDRKFDADVNLDSLQRVLVEEKLTSDNSDYATALKVWDEFGEKAEGMLDSQFGYWVTQRLSQSKD